jgi:ferredoxin-NADP reductase/DMSO/TMAO reductase YedYZ heme-binding membrane subunit
LGATTTYPQAASRRRRRRPAPPSRRAANAIAGIAGLGLAVTLALGVSAESSGSLAAAGGVATFLGRLAGLLAAYGMLIVVLLIARVHVLERAIGQDRLVSWHRRLGPWPLYLLVAHAGLITLGYAQQAHSGFLAEVGTLLSTYPGILAATAGSVLLVMAGVTSYRRARRRMAYETWWAVHLYTYLALGLAFSHQVSTGASFVGHPVARLWWTALWVGAAVLVIGHRIAMPIARSLRHQLRVEEVRREGPGVVSLILRGKGLDRLRLQGGQFFQWRFLARGMWWQAHPYSLSALPRPPFLRLTVKDLGDHSSWLARVKPGMRVAIEGPYGTFTRAWDGLPDVALIGAGVGITPLLALLEDLPAGTDVAVITRASSEGELVLHDELSRLVEERGGRLHELVGSRHEVPLGARELLRLIPDLDRRELYVCGPDGFSDAIVQAARDSGTPRRHIHRESFAF